MLEQKYYIHTYLILIRYNQQRYCHIFTFSVMTLACFVRDLYGMGGELINIHESDGSDAENFELSTMRDYYLSHGYHSINDLFKKD